MLEYLNKLEKMAGENAGDAYVWFKGGLSLHYALESELGPDDADLTPLFQKYARPSDCDVTLYVSPSATEKERSFLARYVESVVRDMVFELNTETNLRRDIVASVRRYVEKEQVNLFREAREADSTDHKRSWGSQLRSVSVEPKARTSFVIDKSGVLRPKVLPLPDNRLGDVFYMSSNESIQFESSKFALVRVKANFLVTFVTEVGCFQCQAAAEVLDVSIPYKDDASNKAFYKNKGAMLKSTVSSKIQGLTVKLPNLDAQKKDLAVIF